MTAGEELLAQGGAATGALSERCAICGEATAGNIPAAGCPFAGNVGCPMHDGTRLGRSADPLAETVAYRPEGEAALDTDGFPAVDDLIGTVLGQYRIEELIGRGSMGRVYRAEHTGLGRTSAIKVMNPGLLARQPQIVERFRAEARAVASLVHPHVVTVHNLGTDRGYHYIEMEYVPGGISLKETLVRQGALEPVRATTLVRQVALALGAAHRAGLVHRDVKPANVLLAADGRAKLADFGLVRRLADERAGAPLAGTPTFMAPELFRGAPAGPQTDLYAVGVMYFFLLTARLPFASDNLGTLIRLHQRQAVPDVRRWAPAVPDEVAAILGRLLAKTPDGRYESAEALADDLKGVLAHLRDSEALIREGLVGLEGYIQGGRDQFRILLPVPGDRLQEVYVEACQSREGQRLVRIFSVCGPADPRHFEFALKLNTELTIGGLSIKEVNGQPMFVMTRTYAWAHVTPADIRAAILEIARRGDWVEQQLTQNDLF
ncbi:MAG: serine/threonine protein kinase [Isosphaeraceae bacterium]|nr:serine/threonine protein kinase [Isosphaeraceae bacterium]